MPWLPSMNWVKNVTLKPMNTSHEADPAQPFSLYMRPVILGHQWCMPPIMAMSALPIIT